jgi:YfiH family protein
MRFWFAGADAMVTNIADLPLVVMVADCIALSFFDPQRHVIGLAHAGWKGSLGRIAQKTVSTMADSFECDPGDIIACISPSIGKGHYEIGQDIFDAYKKEFGRPALDFIREDMDGTCYLDLWMVNEAQLLAAGLNAANIEVSEMCTACHPDLFYSHRHENGNTGRFAGLIELHASGQRSY